jgi:hypothetical protein
VPSEPRSSTQPSAESASDRERARVVDAAIPVVERQLELVRGRQQRLSEFAVELR